MAYKRKPYRIKMRIKVVLWSLVALVAFTFASKVMEQPSKGTIVQTAPESTLVNQEEAPKANVITAKYFSLSYDATLDTVSDISEGDKNAFEVYRVARSDVTGRRTFVVTIKQLPPGGITEESSYKFRQINGDTYKESTEMIGGTQFVIMEKIDGTELTAFAGRDGRLAVLAYTLATPDGDLRGEAFKLLAGFEWRQ